MKSPFIFAAVLNEIQNGPPSSVHIELAQQLNADDVVVTFNWDTLMDRALHVTGEWTADRGYGFLPRSIHRQGWRSPNESDCAPETKLIKLHGSTNWLTSHPTNAFSAYELTQEAAPNTVWVYESTSEPYACFAGRFMGGYEDFSYGYYPPNILDDPGRKPPEGHVIVRVRPKFPWVPEGTAPDSGLVSIPLIIPPVHNKRYSAFGALFDELWEAAENGIYSANHIIIVGYSFPNTDSRSNKLFLSALGRRSTVPLVTILDPAPEAIEYKLHMEFGIPKSHLRVRKEFLSESTDVASLFKIS